MACFRPSADVPLSGYCHYFYDFLRYCDAVLHILFDDAVVVAAVVADVAADDDAAGHADVADVVYD